MGTSPEEFRTMSVFWLSGKEFADCYSPDTSESEGAEFLDRVRRDVLELIEDNPDKSKDDLMDSVHEIADQAPSIYTHTKWKQFLDLGAYNETPDVSGEWPENLSEAAGWALYQIADRLARAMITEIMEWKTEQNDEIASELLDEVLTEGNSGQNTST